MADLDTEPAAQRITAAGLAGLFGLFAGLCAFFAGCVGLSDGYDAFAQARWPVASAVVDHADVVAVTRPPDGGGGTLWYLRSRVRFEVNGEPRSVTLTSRSFFSQADATCLQAWTTQHGEGSEIDVRYDPSRPDRAVFAEAELSSAAWRARSGLMIFSVAAGACAVLLTLARRLRRSRGKIMGRGA